METTFLKFTILFFAMSYFTADAQFTEVAHVHCVGGSIKTTGGYKSYITIGEQAIDSYRNLGTSTGTIGFLTNDYSITTGVSDIDEDSQGLNLFPNPVLNKVTLNFSNPKSNTAYIKVMNAYGDVVFSKQTNMQTQDINIASLTNGIYVVIVQTESSHWEKKVVKID